MAETQRERELYQVLQKWICSPPKGDESRGWRSVAGGPQRHPTKPGDKKQLSICCPQGPEAMC